MSSAPIPNNENYRLKNLYQTNLLDSKADEKFDRITRAALVIFDVPIASVSLIDQDREWFKSCQGLTVSEQDRSTSFCGHTIVENQVFVIPDTQKDPRFAQNPHVLGEPYIRFYAGVPIKSKENYNLGAFCIKDIKPRPDLNPVELVCLTSLGHWTEAEIQCYRS